MGIRVVAAAALMLVFAAVAQAAAPYDAGSRWTALALLDEDFDQQAEDALAAIVARDPRFASDHVNLGRARLKLGKAQAAIEALKTARALDHDSALAAYLHG